jgi:PAS domain S-box-containing protein
MRRRLILAGVAVTLLVAGTFLALPDPVSELDSKVCDLLTGLVSRGQASGRVVIVDIDEASLARFGRWPWPRDVLALLVRRISDRGAATIALDLMLHGEDGGTPSPARARLDPACAAATNDEALACEFSGRQVLIGYAFAFDKTASSSAVCNPPVLPLAVFGKNQDWEQAFYRASGAICTLDRIANAAAGNGFLNAAPDRDGKLRQVPLVVEYNDRQFPSLALAAFQVYRRAASMQVFLNAHEASQLRVGGQTIRVEGRSSMRLRFRGAGRTFPFVPAVQALSETLPADAFRGKIVVVGGSAVGFPNPVVTPVDPLFPDVEVQATAIDNLLQGDSFCRPASFYLCELLLAALAGVAATFVLLRVPSAWSVWIALGIAAGVWTGCALLLAGTGLLLSPLPASAVVACSIPVVALLNYGTEKRRAESTEQQLASAEQTALEVQRESESRYQRLVENVNDAIIIDDREGRLVFANRRFREWFGVGTADIREVVLEAYVAPEWRDRLREQHDRRMRGEGGPGHYEYEGIRPDGTRIWIEALVTNLEQDGQITGTQAALRDITERKRMEAQYLQAQKMESLGRLAGIVAHDFNNLLTVINGYSDMLLSKGRDAYEYGVGLKEIRAAGERARELTHNLLTFSRKQVAQPKALDLNVVVAGAEKMFGRLMGEDIELITRLSPELGLILADAGQMHQILMNLLVNARDAMPHGGRIVIETKNVEMDEDERRRHPEFEAGSCVYLGVSDTGAGMSDEVKQHLFEPFFTTKDLGKGTGLGLATIYGIVQQSSGAIEVTSRLGEGTAFHIYLPRFESEPAAQSDADTSLPSARGSETILVVEDQDAVRQYVCAVLEQSGYRVLQAADSHDAIAEAEQFDAKIHLLLTDVILPGVNGQELADKLKVARPEMKVLFMSGYAQETIGGREILASDVAVLPKPFGPEALRAKVRAALGSAATVRGASQ